MYHRKSYFGSETSAWNFGFFKKVLHVFLLSNLVTLGRPTEIKTKRTFYNFQVKLSTAKIYGILSLWENPMEVELPHLRDLPVATFFVEIRCKVSRRLHHFERPSSFFSCVCVRRPELPDVIGKIAYDLTNKGKTHPL